MNDYSHKTGIRIHATNFLSNLGLPCPTTDEDGNGARSNSNHWDTAKIKFNVDERDPVKIFRTKVFNAPLKGLKKKHVQLKTGQILPVPKIIHELCEWILENVETEGIFRKSGSRSKQQKIKSRIDERGRLTGENLNVVDVAAVLRYFLRVLPEPLIPYAYHNLFLACLSLKNKKEMLLIATLLLPIDNLNLLTYLMQFFNEVASHSHFTKMNSDQLAVCISGDIIPVSKFSPNIFEQTAKVTRLLIKESYEIGVITTSMQKKLDLKGRLGYKETTSLVSLLNDFKKFISDLIYLIRNP